MARRFAIPDVHGCVMTFGIMVDEGIKLKQDDTLYLLGDYVDRGRDSKGVLDRIIRMREAGFNIEAVCGNHDDWFRRWLRGQMHLSEFRQWCMNGGSETMGSFQANAPSDVDEKYLNLIESLPKHIELEDYVLVHGGLNLYLKDPINRTSTDDKMWERPYGEETMKDEWPLGNKKLLVGHTTRTNVQIRRYIESNANTIMLDNGCVFKNQNHKGYGCLAAFNLDTKELRFQTNIDESFGW